MTVYTCEHCGRQREASDNDAKWTTWLRCECGSRMLRPKYASEVGGNTTNPWHTKGELHTSQAMAVHPKQIKQREAMNKKLGVSCEGHNEWGEPRFSSYQQKRKYAKAWGLNFRNAYI